MTRANRVTVVATTTGLVATYWRTHKQLAIVTELSTTWTPDAEANSTANREAYRKFIIDNSAEFGIDYDATDRRTDDNKFPSTWQSEAQIGEWAIRLASKELGEWESKAGNIEIASINFLGMTDVVGKDMKYANGNYGWAHIELEVIVRRGDKQADLLVPMGLVSGQMKKPVSIGSHKWTYTGLLESVTDELGDASKDDIKLADLTLDGLKDIAKGLGITGTSKMKKDALVAKITEAQSVVNTVVE